MHNWKLPHNNLTPNQGEILFGQHRIFTRVMDGNLWSIKSNRSTVFFIIHHCGSKRQCTLVKYPSLFFSLFAWATVRRRAMERSRHIQTIYPILAAGRYLPQFWHFSKLTMLDRKINFKLCLIQNVFWVTHKFPNPKLIFKHCKFKAYFNA